MNGMDKNSLNFGDFLRHKREEKEMTLRCLADMLNVSASFLSDVEKGHRNSLNMDNLIQLKQILDLSDVEYQILLNLAGKQRKTVAPDLPEYIMERDYVASALRIARDLDADETDWQCFVEELIKRKGVIPIHVFFY